MSGDMMPKQQYDFIKGIQDNMLEASNMTEDDAWRFGFLIWQHQEWICKYLIDRKTEPSNSEIPNNCEVKNYCDDCLYADTCDSKEFFYACTSKATISKMEQVDEPKTQIKTQNSNLTFEKRTMLDCYNCKYFCTENCRECHYEPKDEPQTDCAWR